MENDNTSWSKSLEEIIQRAERSAVVEHLVKGLREGLDAELYQESLEKAEEDLAKNHVLLFEEFRQLEGEQESAKEFDTQAFWQETLAKLQQNFSDKRLETAREVQKNMELLQEFLEGDSSNGSLGSDSVDCETVSMLVGMGLGALVGYSWRKSLFAGVGGALAGGLLGVLASDVLDDWDLL